MPRRGQPGVRRPRGHEVGRPLADFTAVCYNGSAFHLAEQRGKVTFIHCRATCRTPCIQELPRFEALYPAHAGSIVVIAVHSCFVTQDPEAFLTDKGCAFPFANDSGNALMALAGGTDTPPRAVVPNRRGAVIFNKVGSVTPEPLKALYEEASK